MAKNGIGETLAITTGHNTISVISARRNLGFYRECYGRLGYRDKGLRKIGKKYAVSFVQDDAAPRRGNAQERDMFRGKLRFIEENNIRKYAFGRSFAIIFGYALAIAALFNALYFISPPFFALTVLKNIIGIVILAVVTICFCLKLADVIRWHMLLKATRHQLRDFPAESPGQDTGGGSLPRPAAETGGGTRIISVLFTRGKGRMPDIIYWMAGRQYTHASLGLGRQVEEFYSFNAKGFRLEHPAHRKLRNNKKESLCIQLRVTKDEYESIRTAIGSFMDRKDMLGYNKWGVVLSILRIHLPIDFEGKYFCSEFVADQLRGLDSFKLHYYDYMPTNLAKALIRQKNVDNILVNEV